MGWRLLGALQSRCSHVSIAAPLLKVAFPRLCGEFAHPRGSAAPDRQAFGRYCDVLLGCRKRRHGVLGGDKSRAKGTQGIEDLLTPFFVHGTNRVSDYGHRVIAAKQAFGCEADAVVGRHSEDNEL